MNYKVATVIVYFKDGSNLETNIQKGNFEVLKREEVIDAETKTIAINKFHVKYDGNNRQAEFEGHEALQLAMLLDQYDQVIETNYETEEEKSLREKWETDQRTVYKIEYYQKGQKQNYEVFKADNDAEAVNYYNEKVAEIAKKEDAKDFSIQLLKVNQKKQAEILRKSESISQEQNNQLQTA